MKIVDLRTTLIAVPFKKPTYWPYGKWEGISVVLVEIETDSGLVGLGESACLPWPPEGCEIFLQGVKPLLLDESPFDTERIIKKIEGLGGWVFGRGYAGYALGGIDMALWDLVGQAAGQPLYNLSGGRVRDGYKVMHYVPYDQPEKMAEEAAHHTALGFETIYLKYSDIKHLCRAVAAIREAVGEEIDLWVDFNQTLSAGFAVSLLKRLEKYRLDIAEQPTLAGNLEELAHVRRHSAAKILAHESSWNFYDAVNVVKAGAADILSLEPRLSWGVAGCKKVAAIAEGAGLPVAMHSCAELGVAQACFAHVAVGLPNLVAASQQMNDWFEDDYIVDKVPLQNGLITPPDKPGLGVAIDRDKVAEFHRNHRRTGGYSIAAVDRKNLALTPTPSWPSY